MFSPLLVKMKGFLITRLLKREFFREVVIVLVSLCHPTQQLTTASENVVISSRF